MQPAPASRPIVIVDDEKSFTDMIGMLLGEYLDAPVRTYTHATDVLAELDTLQPGIIVTDYYMPGMSGLDLIRAVHEKAPALHCVIITGHHLDLHDHAAHGLGNLKTVLHKPFRWQELADVIIQNWTPGLTPPSRRQGFRRP